MPRLVQSGKTLARERYTDVYVKENGTWTALSAQETQVASWQRRPDSVRRPVYVVLAAGESRRMGFDKIVRPLGLRSPLARVAAALGQRRALIVVPPNLSDEAARIAPAARIVINRERARGMAHSLHLALSLIERESPFGVLLGDMPSMTEATIDRTEAMLCGDVDVAFPVDLAGTAGHPVLFSARARTIVR